MCTVCLLTVETLCRCSLSCRRSSDTCGSCCFHSRSADWRVGGMSNYDADLSLVLRLIRTYFSWDRAPNSSPAAPKSSKPAMLSMPYRQARFEIPHTPTIAVGGFISGWRHIGKDRQFIGMKLFLYFSEVSRLPAKMLDQLGTNVPFGPRFQNLNVLSDEIFAELLLAHHRCL